MLKELSARKAQVEAEKLRKQQEYETIKNDALEAAKALKKKKASPKSKQKSI